MAPQQPHEVQAEAAVSARFERRVTMMVLACTLLAPVLALIAP